MTNPIERVAERLQGSWQQGSLGDIGGDGPVCLVGAILSVHGYRLDSLEFLPAGFAFEDDNRVVFPTQESYEIREHVCKTMWKTRGFHAELEDFNDDEKTTEEDVLLLLKKAAQSWGTHD